MDLYFCIPCISQHSYLYIIGTYAYKLNKYNNIIPQGTTVLILKNYQNILGKSYLLLALPCFSKMSYF